VPAYVPDGKLPPDAARKPRPDQQPKRALAAPLLTAAQVADLAGDPAMLP
jgi:hypothetical protein